MATVIDAFVIEIGFDTTKAVQGRKEAETQLDELEKSSARTGKAIEGTGKQLAEFFSGVKNEAIALIGVFLGFKTIEGLLETTTKRMGGLHDAALAIGASVQDIDALEKAIARNGGTIDAAHGSLIKLADALQQFRTGQGGPTNIFGALGVQQGDDALIAYRKYFDFVQKHINDPKFGPAVARQWGQQLGLDDGTITATIRLAQNGPGGLDQALAESKKLGLTTQEMSDNAIKFNTALIRLEQAAGHAADVFADQITPTLTKALDLLTSFITDPAHTLPAAHLGPFSYDPLAPTPELDEQYPWWDPRRYIHIRNKGEGGGPPNAPLPPDNTVPTSNIHMTPELRAFADLVSRTEGAGYNTRYGGGTFDTNGPHPGNLQPGDKGYDPNVPHSPAGRYQFIQKTWNEAIQALGLPDRMTPENQDKAFAWLVFQRHHVTPEMLADPGQRAEIIRRLAPEWASLPGGKQPRATIEQVNRALDYYLEQEKKRQAAEVAGAISASSSASGDAGAASEGSTGSGVPSEPPANSSIPKPMSPFRMDGKYGDQSLLNWQINPGSTLTPAPIIGTNDNSTSVNISALNIHTKDGDPRNIAKHINGAITDEIIGSANTGLS